MQTCRSTGTVGSHVHQLGLKDGPLEGGMVRNPLTIRISRRHLHRLRDRLPRQPDFDWVVAARIGNTKRLSCRMLGIGACSDAVLAFAKLSGTTGLYVPVEWLRRLASGCFAYKLECGIGNAPRLSGDNVTVRSIAADLPVTSCFGIPGVMVAGIGRMCC